MGLSKHIWRPPLTYDDLEFQNGELVKVRGIRPYQMDGYQLKATLEQVAAMFNRAIEGDPNQQANFALLAQKVAEAGEPPMFKSTVLRNGGRPLPSGSVYIPPPVKICESPDSDPGGDSNGVE